MSSDDIASLNLIGAQLQLVVVDNHDQNDISIVLQPAHYQITGSVRDSNQQPLTNVGVSAGATIGGLNYNAYTQTDTNGDYTLHVLNGMWTVGVNCDDLHGLPCFSNRNVTVDGSNEAVDFIAGAACVGDCRNQQAVTIDNIFTMVAIALGEADISVCQNSAHMVTVTQVLAAIHNAVDGCNP